MRFCSATVLAGLFFLVLTGICTSARAEAARHAAMIIDANSGKVLHDVNGDEPRHPASLTKLMTLYLAFEAINQGRLTLDSELTVSEAAASVAPSKLELAPGDTITLADAIKALVTKSANDMAVAVAEKISGNERAFAELMTKRARQIGMRSTTFRNASGLPDNEQLTTARDMLTLALRLHDDFPDKVRVFSLREFTYKGKTYRTHNTLMKSFPGMDGMKTGYTRDSGFNLVASVHRDGKHLVAAVFGGVTASSRNAHMRQILTRALDDASTEKTRIAKPQLIASARPVVRKTKDAVPDAKAASPQKPVLAAAIPAPKPAVKPEPKAAAAKTVGVAEPVPAAAIASERQAPAAPEKAATVPAGPDTSVQVQQSVSVAPPPAAPAAANPDEPQQTVSVTPPIAVASVRTIAISPDPPDPVGPDSSPAKAVATAEPQTSEASAVSKLDFAALRRAIAGPGTGDSATAEKPRPAALERSITTAPAATDPARQDESIVAKAAGSAGLGRPPSTLSTQAALLKQAGRSADETPAQAAAVTQDVAFTTIGIGRAPSTLEAQAQADAASPPVASIAPVARPPMGLAGPNSAVPAIQIGAYASEKEAGRQLEAIAARAQGILAGSTPVTRRIESGGRQLYAARFGGLDQAAAAKACGELQRQQIDCFVVPSR